MLTRAGSSFWLPELGCHVEWGPRLAVVNWPQLICSLNAAFCLFTPVLKWYWMFVFPRKGNCKGRTKWLLVFISVDLFLETKKNACCHKHILGWISYFTIKSKAKKIRHCIFCLFCCCYALWHNLHVYLIDLLSFTQYVFSYMTFLTSLMPFTHHI